MYLHPWSGRFNILSTSLKLSFKLLKLQVMVSHLWQQKIENQPWSTYLWQPTWIIHCWGSSTFQSNSNYHQKMLQVASKRWNHLPSLSHQPIIKYAQGSKHRYLSSYVGTIKVLSQAHQTRNSHHQIPKQVCVMNYYWKIGYVCLNLPSTWVQPSKPL